MEQTQYWMWRKEQQYGMGSHIFPSSKSPVLASRGGDSWEEQAFAEDAAAGALRGCIWPPRSYSCTFCNKEFRSAQALGGHMNVHRRDRARLKQSQAPQTDTFPHENANKSSILLNQGTIFEDQSQHQTCNLIFNPNLEFDNRVIATTSSPIRVSSAPRLDFSQNKTQYLFPYADDQSTIFFRNKSNLKKSERQSHFLRDYAVAEPESTIQSEAIGENIIKADLSISENPRARLESTMTSRPTKRDIKADLSISLNLVICSNSSCASDDDDEDEGRWKKRRTDPSAALKLFYNVQDSNAVSSTNEQRRDDVDLELRLGDPPKFR